jgi:ABC-type enterochelin transport system permease subunit
MFLASRFWQPWMIESNRVGQGISHVKLNPKIRLKRDAVALLLPAVSIFVFGGAMYWSASANQVFLAHLFLLLTFGVALVYIIFFVCQLVGKK